MISVKKALYKLIEAYSKISVESFATGSFSASSYYTTKTINIAKTGKTPIGIAGWTCNQAALSFYKIELSNTTVTIGVATTNQQNINNANVTVYVLYK